MPREGRRWSPVWCEPCNQNHGYTAGALLVVIEAYQRGELLTLSGKNLCPLPLVTAHVPRSTDRVVDFVERISE